ncbi:MAG: chloride channel protein [Anaerolineales bacterium]
MSLFNTRFRLLNHFAASENLVIFGTSIVVGVGTGLGAIAFIYLIGVARGLFFDVVPSYVPSLGRGVLILLPAIGGLLGGPIIAYIASEAKGHGVPEVMQAIAMHGSRIRPRVVVAKVAASALCIGSGGSAGREGPIVQVGSALGSTIGQWLHLSESRVRNLVACGSAAGIAATFNAPIAGVIFAVEIIIGELSIGTLGNVVVASVAASTLSRAVLGDRPAFTIPLHSVRSPWEIALYALLGIFAALVGVFFIKTLYWFEDRFDEWRFPDALKPAVGGLLLGVLGFGYPLVLNLDLVLPGEALAELPIAENIPHVFGPGLHAIEGALLGEQSLALLVAIMLLKLLATSFTLGSGNSGGVFAPALVMGAALGGAYGHLATRFLPGVSAGVGPYATVGMAAVFAAAARAPLTAVLIVFEMTDDFRIILPLMTAVVVATLLAQALHKESIYTLKLARRGINLAKGRAVDVLSEVQVQEVMIRNLLPLAADTSIGTAMDYLLRVNRRAVPVVVDENKLYGIVTLTDLRAAQERRLGAQTPVGEVATTNVVTIFPDESVHEALLRMAPRDLSRLPVVTRTEPPGLLGIVRRNDILRAYEIGLVRGAQSSSGETPLPPPTGANIVHVPVTAESRSAGVSLADLNLPRECVVVSIIRNGRTVVPRGDTVLLAGDDLTVLTDAEGNADIHALF